MHRFPALAALAAAAVTPVLALAGPAAAAPPAADQGPVSALAEKVFLGGDPWAPRGELTVSVRNGSEHQDRGRFLLHLPQTARLTPNQPCVLFDWNKSLWLCEGGTLEAGESRTHTLTVQSVVNAPVFDIVDQGHVQGYSDMNETSKPISFPIAWPARLPLKLAATAGRVTGGAVDVAVRVTNAGSFTLGAYSVNVKTPAGVRVASPACSDTNHNVPAGCELYRTRQLAAGATDRFTIRLTVPATPVTVQLVLEPSARYTNKDTTVSLTLNGAAATTPPAPAATTPAAPAAGGSGGGSTGGSGGGYGTALPVTGDRTAILAGSGAALVALGAGLVLSLRRRRFQAA
jgi:LPXTG-motif cell wall-anchored protein